MTVTPSEPAPAEAEGAAPASDGPGASALPRFNWGAFLLPPVWGVAHGMWAGVFFLPLWAFVDEVARGSLGRTGWMRFLTWGMAGVTLAFQFLYARTANAAAWARVCEHMTLAAYVRRERVWAIAGVATVAVLVVWVSLYAAR